MSQGTPQCPNATLQCLCNSTSFQADVAHCVETSCTDPRDQQNAYEYAVEACAEANVTLPPMNDIGQTSTGTIVKVEHWIVMSVVVGAVFAGGLV